MTDLEILRTAARQMRDDASELTDTVDYLTDAHQVQANAAAFAARRTVLALPAVADWLDSHARDLESAVVPSRCDSPGDLGRALAVARAYLGVAS